MIIMSPPVPRYSLLTCINSCNHPSHCISSLFISVLSQIWVVFPCQPGLVFTTLIKALRFFGFLLSGLPALASFFWFWSPFNKACWFLLPASCLFSPVFGGQQQLNTKKRKKVLKRYSCNMFPLYSVCLWHDLRKVCQPVKKGHNVSPWIC